MSRVIALIDMDCFYVQVEQRSEPVWQGLPCAVVQYKPYRGGSIIAINYEARAAGVSRFICGDEAVAACPSIHLFRVPEQRGKADLTKYRDAGREVCDVMMKHPCVVERASVDEAYLDLTQEVNRRYAAGNFPTPDQLPNTVVEAEYSCDAIEGHEKSSGFPVACWLQNLSSNDASNVEADRRLAIGAAIIEEIRADIYRTTGFRCSAGIAQNKILAKLTCGLHKPNKQTVLPSGSVNFLFSSIPVKKIRGFGGKFGSILTKQLGVEKMIDVQRYSEAELRGMFDEKTARWVYEICRGIDNDPVSSRHLSKSIGCGKNFLGPEQLDKPDKVRHWLTQLVEELVERLEKDKEENNRVSSSLSVMFSVPGFPHYQSTSRAIPLTVYNAQRIVDDVFSVLSKFNVSSNKSTEWSPPIWNISLSAGKFNDLKPLNTKTLKSFFSVQTSESSSRQLSAAASSSSSSVSSPSKSASFLPSCSSTVDHSYEQLNCKSSSFLPSSTVDPSYEKLPSNNRFSECRNFSEMGSLSDSDVNMNENFDESIDFLDESSSDSSSFRDSTEKFTRKSTQCVKEDDLNSKIKNAVNFACLDEQLSIRACKTSMPFTASTSKAISTRSSVDPLKPTPEEMRQFYERLSQSGSNTVLLSLIPPYNEKFIVKDNKESTCQLKVEDKIKAKGGESNRSVSSLSSNSWSNRSMIASADSLSTAVASSSVRKSHCMPTEADTAATMSISEANTCMATDTIVDKWKPTPEEQRRFYESLSNSGSNPVLLSLISPYNEKFIVKDNKDATLDRENQVSKSSHHISSSSSLLSDQSGILSADSSSTSMTTSVGKSHCTSASTQASSSASMPVAAANISMAANICSSVGSLKATPEEQRRFLDRISSGGSRAALLSLIPPYNEKFIVKDNRDTALQAEDKIVTKTGESSHPNPGAENRQIVEFHSNQKKLYRFSTASQSQNLPISKMFSKAKYKHLDLVALECISVTDDERSGDNETVSNQEACCSKGKTLQDNHYSISVDTNDELRASEKNNNQFDQDSRANEASQLQLGVSGVDQSESVSSDADQSGCIPVKSDEEDMMTCSECGERISVWEMPEHSDFHFALNLQKSQQISQQSDRDANLKRKTSALQKSTPKKKSLGSATKRKDGESSKACDSSAKLDNYFQRL